jgi:hypothetical protein
LNRARHRVRQAWTHRTAILLVIDSDAQRWAARVEGFSRGWVHAAGAAHALIALAERIGQLWLKGVRLALKLG